MDTSLRTARFTALPGSQRQSLSFTADQPPLALRLKALQSIHVRVTAGRLWLTEDGKADDCFLLSGQHLLLLGPACYRLGAVGQEGVQLLLVEPA